MVAVEQCQLGRLGHLQLGVELERRRCQMGKGRLVLGYLGMGLQMGKGRLVLGHLGMGLQMEPG